MASEADFIFELLSDVWNDYEERGQISALWEGWLQLGSDLVLQLFQADLSKSIDLIPEFRRYRWLHYDLSKTVVPSTFCCAYVFAYDSGDSDTLSVPFLSDQVRTPEDDEYLHITNGSNGILTSASTLTDSVSSFPASVRVGDVVRFTSGTGLAEEDTDYRFLIERIISPNEITLSSSDISDASSVNYVIERAPFLSMLEGDKFVVQDGKLMFLQTPILTPDGSATDFQVVEEFSYTGDFIRDDPRIGDGRGVAEGTDGVIESGKARLISTSATFTSSVTVGDYLVVRTAQTTQPTQVVTSQIVSKVVDVVDDQTIEVRDRFSTSASSLTYVVLQSTIETITLVSTENGTDEFPFAYAVQNSNPDDPTSTDGELQDQGDPDGDVLVDTTQTFTQDLVGKQLRVFPEPSTGSGLDPAELAPFTIVALKSATELLLDRKLTYLSTAADVMYSIGSILEIDVLAPVSDPTTLIYADEFDVTTGTSNPELVTDGTVSFNSDIVLAQPYIRRLRERRTTSPVNEETPLLRLWAEESVLDQDQLFKNFGFPIQVQQENSEEYKNVLQGLWFAYWYGPTPGNIVRGLNLVFDLPYAPADGVITDISLPDPAFIIGTVDASTNVPVDTFDVSATNPQGDSRFLAFSVDDGPPTYITFVDPTPGPPGLEQLPATEVRDQINTAVGSPVASLTLGTTGQVKLSALTSVKVDTVIGNPGLGFDPGTEDFGVFNVTIRYDDGTEETHVFGTQFPLDIAVGDRVEKFQPLTQAVGVFDYVSLPGWWDLFNIASINPNLTVYSPEDRDILNDILKDFTFAVRVVADAFTRLGPVDRNLIHFFLEQIKPTISDYLFIVSRPFRDVLSVSDDRNIHQTSPLPRPGFITQHAGEAPYMPWELTLPTARNISWNFANYHQLSPAERVNFQENYQLGQYDDFRLGTEDIVVNAPFQADLISGVSGSYKDAIVYGTQFGNRFSTTESLVLRWNGFVPFIIQSSAFQAESSLPQYNPPLTMDAQQAADFINSEWAALYSGSFLDATIVFVDPATGGLVLRLRTEGTFGPRLEVLQQHFGFGFLISDVTGVGSSSSGSFFTVQAS